MTNFKTTKQGRFYPILDNRPPFVSVTTALNIIAKHALVPWAAKKERELCLDVAGDMISSGRFDNSSTSSPSISPSKPSKGGIKARFISLMESELGKAKAHTRELEAAGEIGTQIHAMCEWTNRKMLGLKVGPEPKISEAAQWGFMAYEDKAKELEIEPIASEMKVYSIEHEYAGTMDLLARVKWEGKRVIALCDYKSGKAVYDEAHLQNSAYIMACREMGHAMGMKNPEIGLIIRIPKNQSDPQCEVVPNPDIDGNFKAFLHALELWRWQYNLKK